MHIAIVGCGQLSRMMALAGVPMGINFSFVAEPEEDTRCVTGLGNIVRWQQNEPAESLYKRLGEPDRITVERELVSAELLTALQQFCPVHPKPKAVHTCQHRYREKLLLEKLGVACTPYIYGGTSLQSATCNLAELSLPAVVKTCSGGYDGKNQWVLKNAEDVATFESANIDQEFIIEQWIPFDREVSQVSVRSANGDIHHYPLTENVHQQGILKQSIAPAPETSQTVIDDAQQMIGKIMEELEYVGILAMECFLTGDKLMVNELAPRVHNSGHWTQAGAATCQFENHVRAVAGFDVGSTQTNGVTGMLNLIGLGESPLNQLSAHASVHWYGKTQRQGRKAGHINFSELDYDALVAKMRDVSNALDIL